MAGVLACPGVTARLPGIALIFRMAADTDSQTAATVQRPRFWLAPLLAGCCFSLGYGVTHRLMAMQSAVRPVKPEAFKALPFPGNSLNDLRSRAGETAPLQVDLAAIDARESPRKREQPRVQPQPDATPALALQTPPVSRLSTPEPQPIAPSVSGDQLPASAETSVERVPVAIPPVEMPAPVVAPLFESPLVAQPLAQPVAAPLPEAAAPLRPALADDFFLPVLPQAPPPPPTP